MWRWCAEAVVRRRRCGGGSAASAPVGRPAVAWRSMRGVRTDAAECAKDHEVHEDGAPVHQGGLLHYFNGSVEGHVGEVGARCIGVQQVHRQDKVACRHLRRDTELVLERVLLARCNVLQVHLRGVSGGHGD